MTMATWQKLGAAAVACSLFAGAARAADVSPFVADAPAAADVRLVDASGVATIYVDPGEAAVVRHAASLLGGDVGRVTGRALAVVNDAATLKGTAVLVGTIGQSKVIDGLISAGKLDAASVRGQWETFVIQTVEAPIPGVDRALVIAGSDRRGTAFGVFEVSEQIGVSPWYFWADVPAKRRDALAIKAGTYKAAPPTVKYRGIFINDEDWGLQPWAAKTFDPEFKQLGPKTYEKVFELLLRLKANYLWPGMHHCTVEFGAVDRNVTLADEWGIVMGAAHCEPINRNNVWWGKDGRGEWRYDTNRANVINYWDEWARKRGAYEAVWTVGMRGIHDSGMPGPKDVPGQVKLLEQAIADQRELLTKYVDKDVERVPQVFTPYKEALAHYQGGLKLPDDVTILWCEDNYGYLRQLSNPQEQRRSGGSGVYYHISYLGWPRPYLWLNTTPPALIYSEMSKALDYGADRIWIVNVGDIKPGELGTEFWMRLAWNPKRYGDDAQSAFLKEWAARDFGPAVADEIAGVMNDYFQLGFQRKPELMDDDAFGTVAYREGERRLAAHRAMLERAESINGRLPQAKRDAYYELVLYPVRIATLVNESFVNADLSRLYARQGRSVANEHADRADAAVARIAKETDAFNNEVAGGKWRGMMTVKGMSGNWNVQWPKPARVTTSGAARLGVIVEGQALPIVGEGEQTEPGHDVDVDVMAGRRDAAWQSMRSDDGRAYVVVPNGGIGNALDPAKSKTIAYDLHVPADGKYRLFMRINCPSDKDDSFFVRVDDGPWQTWNDVGTRSAWDWRKQGEYELKAGAHKLTIGLREDGAMLGGIRFTERMMATRLEEELVTRTPRTQLPTFDRRLGESRHFVDVFNAGGGTFDFEATPSAPWIKLSETRGSVKGQARLWAEIDWTAAPGDAALASTITIRGAGAERVVDVRARNLPASAGATFVENDGYVSMEAEHFTRSAGTKAVAWRTVGKLGRSGDAVTTVPADAPSRKDAADATRDPVVLEYDFESTSTGDVKVTAYCLPTQRTHDGRGLRYAIAIDDASPQVVDFHESGGASGEHGNAWRTNVTRNITTPSTKHALGRPGRHTLKVWMVDPGVVIDKLVIDAGGVLPSEMGPPETRVRATEAR